MMKRLLTYVCFCLLSLSLLQAQEAKKIYFEADLLEYDEVLRPNVEHYSGNVRFIHEETIGYCDYADHNRVENILYAYCQEGKQVQIIVNDSVTLTGDYLVYDGNQRVVTLSRQVLLQDNSAALYTDSLIYDLNSSVGYYITGGKMVSQDNVLTSILGHYYAKENMAYLRDSVRLVNESYTAVCNSASYDTQAEIAYFTSRTHFTSEEEDIFTDRGWYKTQSDILLLVGNAEMYGKERYCRGDSLYYDKRAGFGQAWDRVQMVDSAKNFIIQGNYIEYLDSNYTLVTDSSLLIAIEQGDSLFLHADTLHLLFDSAGNANRVLAYAHMKFYRNDLQGACDSLVYYVPDSMITMYYNPIVWSGENQLTADTIFFHIIDSLNMDMILGHAAFIVSALFEDTEFNQIKGSRITGKIQDRRLVQVDVVGNAESLYYIQEEDSSLIGINAALASEMKILLQNNEIESITFYNHTDGKVYPDEQLPMSERLLKRFKWLDLYRPKSQAEIFTLPVPRTLNDENINDDE